MAKVWLWGHTVGTTFTTFNPDQQLGPSLSFPSLTHTSVASLSSIRPPCSRSSSQGSGRDHPFVPLAVGHCAAVVVWRAALIGLLFASVQECLQGLSLAFGFAHHVTGTLRSETGRDEGWREVNRSFTRAEVWHRAVEGKEIKLTKWIDLPFPLLHGGPSSFSPLPQQSRVLHKLVPVNVVLK